MHTEMWCELENKGIIRPFHLIGNAAYQGFIALAHPHVGALSQSEAAYNFLLS